MFFHSLTYILPSASSGMQGGGNKWETRKTFLVQHLPSFLVFLLPVVNLPPAEALSNSCWCQSFALLYWHHHAAFHLFVRVQVASVCVNPGPYRHIGWLTQPVKSRILGYRTYSFRAGTKVPWTHIPFCEAPQISPLFASTFSLLKDSLSFQISKCHQAHFTPQIGPAKWQSGKDVWANLCRRPTSTRREQILSSCWRLWALLNLTMCSSSSSQPFLQISFVPQGFIPAVCYKWDLTLVHWTNFTFHRNLLSVVFHIIDREVPAEAVGAKPDQDFTACIGSCTLLSFCSICWARTHSIV